MNLQPAARAGGHLRYYEQHGISPVRYGMEDLDAHFDRRDSLYRSVGLPPVAFRGARVLEVAPGSGQNSLYLAACLPASLDLVEPNPAGRRDIEASYAGFDRPHTPPNLYPARLEEFAPTSTYDIVICENWLGALPHELALIAKLAGLVAPGGVLILTVVPLSGFFPNVLRKLLALRLDDREADFETRTERMIEVFGPHLATMARMTRSHRDWVHDCMMNPHYLNVALPLESALEAIGEELEVLGTFPRFGQDWRWFKGLTGAERRFNEAALAAYCENTHNFVDHRRIFPPRGAEANAPLETAFRALHKEALAWQAAAARGDAESAAHASGRIDALLGEIGAAMAAIDGEIGEAVAEVRAVWGKADLTAADVRDLRAFGALFGRETVYVSLTRRRGAR